MTYQKVFLAKNVVSNRFLIPIWLGLFVGFALSSSAAGPNEPAPGHAGSNESSATSGSLNLEAEIPSGVDQIVYRTDEIEWGPCPPGPLAGDGCRMAVLEGNPKAEQLFTFRIRITEPFVLPPHTHPRNERVTVIEGALYVGFGDMVDKSASTRFEAGDYYVNRAGAHHFVWSDEPTTVQLTGVGPWAIHPVTEKTAATN